MKYREVKRQAEVGEIIKVTKANHCNDEVQNKKLMVREVKNYRYYVSDLVGNFIYFGKGSSPLWLTEDEFVVLEPIEKESQMTVEEWQSKWYHKTCACCARCYNNFYGDTVCSAKHKNVNKSLLRPFCQMFEPKGEGYD